MPDENKKRFIKSPETTEGEMNSKIEVTQYSIRYRNVSGVANQIRMASYFITIKNNNSFSLRLSDKINITITNGSVNQSFQLDFGEYYDINDLIIEPGESKTFNGSLNNQVLTFNTGGISNFTSVNSGIQYIYWNISGFKPVNFSIVLASGQEG